MWLQLWESAHPGRVRVRVGSRQQSTTTVSLCCGRCVVADYWGTSIVSSCLQWWLLFWSIHLPHGASQRVSCHCKHHATANLHPHQPCAFLFIEAGKKENGFATFHNLRLSVNYKTFEEKFPMQRSLRLIVVYFVNTSTNNRKYKEYTNKHKHKNCWQLSQ